MKSSIAILFDNIVLDSSIGAEAPISTKWLDRAATILKLNEQREIQGVTTAAGLWMTAAIGVACGLGGLGLAVIGTIMTLLILALEHVIDTRIRTRKKH